MKSQFLSLLGTIVAVLSVTAPTAPAHAVNLNTPALVCQQSFTGNSSPVPNRVRYFDPGVANALDVPANIVCSVPRSPVASGVTTVNFYVDGTNSPGASTFCVMSSYDFRGNFVGSRGFTATNTSSTVVAPYDQFVSFPASLVGFFNYVTIMCVLPPSFKGQLHGITAIQ